MLSIWLSDNKDKMRKINFFIRRTLNLIIFVKFEFYFCISLFWKRFIKVIWKIYVFMYELMWNKRKLCYDKIERLLNDIYRNLLICIGIKYLCWKMKGIRIFVYENSI